MLTSCIMPFEPHINIADINKYVVSGQVTDNNEYQIVTISMASPVGDPQYIPVSDCFVHITDDKKNKFTMQESEPGIYKVQIDRSFLKPGTAYKVSIIAPDGAIIESDFDRMPKCPEVDSAYFKVREHLSAEISNQIVKGIQFYLDLDGGNIASRFFRWELIETWEYHVDYPREWYFDGTWHHIFPPDYSRKVCWSTELIKNIYTLSTENLVENKYRMLPLNFVANRTSRLLNGYSLLINQISLSETAYSYWEKMRINSNRQGGLYEKQPLAIEGNLHNNTYPDQQVLGFFNASSVKSKRIFVKNVENLEIEFTGYCNPEPIPIPDNLPPGGLDAMLRRIIDPSSYPVYFTTNPDGHHSYTVLSKECIDCLYFGGTNVKPDFWP